MFNPKVPPITHESVGPSSVPPDIERELHTAGERMTHAVLAAANRSIAIRTRLAEDTLRIVSGDSA